MAADYTRISDHETFAFSAENPTGARSGGSRGGDCTKLRPTVEIQPGEEAELVRVEGPGTIETMWFTGYVGHSFILRIYWDGADFPSVEAPLSAFFGCAYDEALLDSSGNYPAFSAAVMMVAPGRGFNSYWEMPFRKGCRITMENRSAEQKSLYYCITGERGPVAPDAGYFHAAYRQEHPVQRGRSYTVLDGVHGQGQFVGLTLATGMNGHNSCWVEGEARMYLDGDRYPSLHYTGTEDYFGGSYGFGNDIARRKYQTYAGLYSGMFAILGDNSQNYAQQQRFLLYRFHIKDPVRFRSGFRMTLDNLGWTGPRYDDYTSVAFWYQSAPARTPFALPADHELVMR